MKIKLLNFLTDSVFNSFNKNTRVKVYGGKKDKDNGAFRVVYFWRIREKL